MPGKRHAQSSPKDNQKDATVAFVLCHPMDSSLTPVTTELPPCLFPLCNSPVLLYVLNWLNINQVEKIYIICRKRDAKFIKQFTLQCEARMLMEPVTILGTEDAICSYGDALRWIDHWNEVQNQFKHCVVVPGTLITNAPLKTVIKDHEERFDKATSKDLKPILTVIFSQSSEEEAYSAVINQSGSLLHLYTPPELSLNNTTPLRIDPAFFKNQQSIKVKTGLADSHIYICNTQLLANFRTEFDWHSVPNDCIPTQLRNVDILRHDIHAEILHNCYSATIDDLPSYLNASLAVIRRWLYPVTIEMNIFAPNTTYSLCYDDDDDDEDNANDDSYPRDSEEVTAYHLERDLVYLSDNVFPDLTAKIGHSVVIGSNTQLHENCIVKNSVIGCDCVIGKNVVITDSIIWDRVTIEEGAHIRNSLIASDVNVASGVTIDFGSILSFSITVDIDLPPCRRLVAPFVNTAENEDKFRIDNSPEWLKRYVNNKEPLPLLEDSNAYEYTPVPEHELPLLRMWNKLDKDHFPIDPSEIVNDEPDRRNIEEDEESSDESDFIRLDDTFQKAAAELLNTLIKSKAASDQIKQEYISLKNSNNAEHIDCAAGIMIAIITNWSIDDLSQGFDLLSDILQSFLSDIENQEDFLFWWQSYCAKSQQRTDLFIEGLKLLISNQIITDDALDQWSDEQDDCNDAQNKLFELYSQMI